MDFKLKEFETVLSVPRIANIHYFEFANKYHTESDLHPFRELVYVDNGNLYVESDGFSGVLQKNSMVIHKALEPHSLKCTEGEAPGVIIIGFECDCDRLDRFSSTPVTLSPQLQRTLTEVIREGRTVFMPPYDQPGIRDMKKRKDHPFGADQMIRLKLEEFLIMLTRSETAEGTVENDSSNESLADIYAYINENYRQKISLDELCFLYGTNKTTLCKSFRECYGCTVVEYISRKRIKYAKELMRSGKYSISEISSIVGYSSVQYFSRLFKAHERCSPTEYILTVKSKLGI